MKKILILTLGLLLLALTQSASAFNSANTYWDLNAVDNAYFTQDDGITEAFEQLTYYAETTSTIGTGGVVGSTVVDAGRGLITGQNFVSGNNPGDNEGFGALYGMTMLWDNITGVVTYNDGSTLEASYTSGTIDLYIDFNPYSANLSNDASLTDGTRVATIEITSGEYELDLTGGAGSSYLLYGTFSYLLDDFWYLEDGTDMADDYLGMDWVLAYSAGDTDPDDVTITPVGPDLIVDSNHDSSISVGVVPEPTTFALFGLGLLGLAGIGRRKQA